MFAFLIWTLSIQNSVRYSDIRAFIDRCIQQLACPVSTVRLTLFKFTPHQHAIAIDSTGASHSPAVFAAVLDLATAVILGSSSAAFSCGSQYDYPGDSGAHSHISA